MALDVQKRELQTKIESYWNSSHSMCVCGGGEEQWGRGEHPTDLGDSIIETSCTISICKTV